MGWIYGPGEITEQIRQELEPNWLLLISIMWLV